MEYKLNTPYKSNRKNKKFAVNVKTREGKIITIHFGDSRYEHNYSKEAWKNYMRRSAGIRDKEGNLTKDDRTSANFWSRKILWRNKW